MFAIAGLAAGFGQNVTVSPTTLAFGNQALGNTSSVKQVTLKNGQTSAITISAISTSLADYSQTNTCPTSPSTLGAGKSCTISVMFAPSTLGARTGTLTVTDNGKKSSQTVGLSGTGITAVTATPASVSFANQVVGKKSAAATVTIQNNENVALTINSITPNLADYTTTTTCPVQTTSLAAGAKCKISIFFTPAAAGVRSATLTISDNASNSPTVALSGTGLLAATVNPSSLQFGSQAKGTSSSPQVVTLTNNQSSALTITSITSSNSTDFPVTSTCPVHPKTLAALGTCTASVVFSPQATGTRTGTLSFVDSANNSPQTVALTGTGATANLVSIAVSPSATSIPLGTTQQFSAVGTYGDGTTQNLTSSVTWLSSASGVSSISSSGLASPLAVGQTTITATSGSIAGSATLNVSAPVLVSLAIAPGNATLALGTSQALKATGTYSDGSTLDVTATVAWSTGNSAIATANSQGVAKSVAVGSTTVTATLGSVTGSTGVMVSPAALVSIAVTPAIPTIALGTTKQFAATGTFTDGSMQDVTATVQWSSDTATVATVGNTAGSQGLAASITQGTATITATMSGVMGSSTLTVTAATLVSIAVNPASPTIALGTTQAFTAAGTFTDGTAQDVTATVQWSSDTATVATISNTAGSQGLATSVSQGTATITATMSGVTGSTSLTVTAAALVSIAVNPTAATTPVGTTQQFTALGTYTDGSVQDVTQSGHWSSTNALAATISNTAGTQGLASALGTGTSTIAVAMGGVSGTAVLTVNPAALVTLAVNPQGATIALGTGQQYTATGTYTDGSAQDLTSTVQWSTSDATVTVISNAVGTAGLATSAGSGTATITATMGTVTTSTSLTVGPATVVSLAVNPQAATIALGMGQQFQALATYTDGSIQDVTSSANWASDTTSVAIISGGGSASGVGVGSATITANVGNISSAASLAVGPPVLVSLAVTPANSTIPTGLTQQFSALGTYTNGSTQDLTNSVSWSSSAPSVASVSASGLASGTAAGSAVITASLGSVSASTTLNVSAPVLVSLAIAPGNATLALGTSQALKATGTYSDGSTLDVTTTVGWSTGNSAIATVNNQGVAKSVAVGSTTVTATLGSVTGSTGVTVSPAALVSIAVTPAIPTIPLGTTKQFAATGTFTDGSTQDVTATVQWSSDTIAVATVSNVAGSQGLATSVTQGTATITATMSGVTGSSTLTVTAATLVSIAVNPTSPTIALGTTQPFTAAGTFTDGNTQDVTASVQWSSDTATVATVSNVAGSQGLSTSVNQGTATITATMNGVTGSTSLTVTAAALVSIVVNPTAATTPVGTTQQFAATGTYTDGTTQDVTQSGHWSSTNALAATISNTAGTQGLASALGTGTSTIAVAMGGVSGTAVLTVNPAALVTLAVNPQGATIALGTGQQYTATGTYTDGSAQDLTSTVQWSASSALVAVISNAVGTAGQATSAGPGTATITATMGTLTTSTPLTVGPATVVSLAVNPQTATITLGMGQQFQAIATFTDNSSQDVTSSATWSSSSPGVATVNSAGSANTLSPGVTTIGATLNGASAGAVLTVAPAVPVSLAVAPANSSIAFGTQQQFQAFLTYSDGTIQNVTNLVAWSSSVPSVASVSATGLASAVSAGSANIYATASGGMATGGSLTVAPAALISIAVTPGSLVLNLSQSQQFTATGTFADASQQNLTGTVIWSSSKSNSLSINASGMSVAMGFGTATISATSGSVVGSTTVSLPVAATVPASFFDMTINKNTTPWPTDAFYGERLLGTGTLWGNLETANGVYTMPNGTPTWTVLDKFVSNANAHGTDLIYTFLGVPQWASSNSSDATCSSWAGSCDPPNDLNSDGTGSNAQWDAFVTKIATRYGTSIKYWELWNEPNVSNYANKKTWTTAQWIRMAADAHQIILNINPNAVILSPGIAVGTSWLTSFLAAGGANYVNVIAFHGYANPPESVLPLVAAAQSAMSAGGVSNLPLWDTEASWGLDTALPDLEMQAGSTARLSLLQAANGVARFYWYGWDFSARGTLWQPNTLTGCTTPNNGGDICPAGIAYGQVYSWMVGAVLSGCSSSGTIWTCTLARPGGYLAQVMWDSSQTCSNGVCQNTPYTPPPQFIQYRDLYGNVFTLTGTTTVPLGAMPIILEN